MSNMLRRLVQVISTYKIVSDRWTPWRMESLTNEQLCALAQAGDERAKSRLIENNLPFIWQIVKQIAENPLRKELFSSCGIDTDDLIQAGAIGLWKSIKGYDLSAGNRFLTYAKPAIIRSMSDMIRQYSRDTVWRLKWDKANTWNIMYMDEPLDDTGEDTVESLIASPCAKLPEQVCIERETAAELREAMNTLPDRRECLCPISLWFHGRRGPSAC